MPFVAKDWRNLPETTTPLSAAAIEDLEARLADYADGKNSVSLDEYNAVGDGTTNDTTAVANAFNSGAACIFVNSGTYSVTDITPAGANQLVVGESMFQSVFKARSGTTRVLDLRNRTGVTLRDIGVQGNAIASRGIDLDNTTPGASTQNRLERVLVESTTSRGVSLQHNGDTLMDQVLVRSLTSGVSTHWNDQGGNLWIRNCFLGGKLEATWQQAHIVGSALVGGIKTVAGGPNIVLNCAGCYIYAADPALWPVSATAIDATSAAIFSASFDDCTFVVTTNQSCFDGTFAGLLKVDQIDVEAISNAGSMFGGSFAGTGSLEVHFNGGYVSAAGVYTEPASPIKTVYRHFLSAPGVYKDSFTPSFTAASLVNSWVNYGGGFADAGYWKDATGVVHLQGLIKNGTAAPGTILFTLPVGYRPSAGHLFVVSSAGAFGLAQVNANGAVQIVAGSNVDFSLSSISFAAA